MNQGFQNPNQSPYPTNDQIYMPDMTLPVSQDIRRSFLPENDDYAAESNKLISKQSSMHVRSLFATLIFLIGVPLMIALTFTDVIQVSEGALIGICVAIYVFYLILGFCCNPLFQYLSQMQHGANFESSYNTVRNMIGYFSFHAVCYHYQTRHHTRTVTDANGNARTQHYTTQQKVITHTATQNLHPRLCEDESGSVDQVRAGKDIIFVHNKVNYRFKDDYSRNRFQTQWIMFQSRHRRDVHQDYTQNFVLPGLQARQCFYVGKKPKNFYSLFIVGSLLGFMWPSAMYIESKVCRYDIQFLKIITL